MRECSGMPNCKILSRTIGKSNGNTYLLWTVDQYTIPNSMASTIVVQSRWTKSWPGHTKASSESILKLSGSSQWCFEIKTCGIEHSKHTEPSLLSTMPVFLNQKLPTRSAGMIPRGIISIRTLCMASQISPLGSDDESFWCKMWLINGHGLAHVHLLGSRTPTWQLQESILYLNNRWRKCPAKEFWTETWGNPVGYHGQTHS